MLNVIFLGSGDFALSILKSLILDERINLLAVVTQPKSEVGRKKELKPTAVGAYCELIDLKVMEASNSKQILEQVDFKTLDIAICVDYGVLLKQELLDAPRHGIINVHPSLLPKYRGASPLQETLKNGDVHTGVVIQQMHLKMDAGPIYKALPYDLQPEDDISSLSEVLAAKAAEILPDLLHEIVSEQITPVVQEGEPSFCSKIQRSDGYLNPENDDADKFINYYRAYKLWPGISIEWQGQRLKLLEIARSDQRLAPMQIQKIAKRVYLGVKDGCVELVQVQLPSKKSMLGLSFYNGYLS